MGCCCCKCCCDTKEENNEEYAPTHGRQYNYEHNGQRREQAVINNRSVISNYQSFEREQAKADEEENRRAEELRQKRIQKRKEMRETLEREEEANDSRRRRQEDGRRKTFDSDLQKRKEEHERKDEEMRKRVKEIVDEMNRGYELDYRRKLELEQEKVIIERMIIDEQLMFNEVMEEKKREFDNAQQAHQAKMKKIESDFLEKQEKLLKEAEQRRQEMKYQLDAIWKMFQLAVWNQIIENNWTNRLNSLRSANKDSQRLERLCIGTHIEQSKLQEWRLVLDILLEMMKEESQNMSIMYTNTGKSFLLKIKDAVDDVASKSQKLLDELSYSPLLEDKLRRLSSDLNRSCNSIPTLAELKLSYYSEMHNSK